MRAMDPVRCRVSGVPETGRCNTCGPDGVERVTTKRLSITGRVQGVGFRFYFERIARRHGVRGWVRNRSDGSVEAVVQGEDAAVSAVIDWARRGPRSAAVGNVAVSDAEGEYEDFEIRPTL